MSNSDMVNNPNHYDVFGNITAIDIIKVVLDSELTADLTPYQVFCLGNVLKYRLRLGGKDDIKQELHKALKYKQLGERN